MNNKADTNKIKNHTKEVNKKEFKCKLCYEVFHTEADYSDHVTNNSVIFCNICKNKFCDHRQYAKHQRDCFQKACSKVRVAIKPERDEEHSFTDVKTDINIKKEEIDAQETITSDQNDDFSQSTFLVQSSTEKPSKVSILKNVDKDPSKCVDKTNLTKRGVLEKVTANNNQRKESKDVNKTNLTGNVSDQVTIRGSVSGEMTLKVTKNLSKEVTRGNHKSANQRKEQKLLEIDTIEIISGLRKNNESKNMSIKNEDLRMNGNVNNNLKTIGGSSSHKNSFSKNDDDLSDRFDFRKESNDNEIEAKYRINVKNITHNTSNQRQLKNKVDGINRWAINNRPVAQNSLTSQPQSLMIQERNLPKNQNFQQNTPTTTKPIRQSLKSNQERNPPSLSMNSSPLSKIGTQVRVISSVSHPLTKQNIQEISTKTKQNRPLASTSEKISATLIQSAELSSAPKSTINIKDVLSKLQNQTISTTSNSLTSTNTSHNYLKFNAVPTKPKNRWPETIGTRGNQGIRPFIDTSNRLYTNGNTAENIAAKVPLYKTPKFRTIQQNQDTKTVISNPNGADAMKLITPHTLELNTAEVPIRIDSLTSISTGQKQGTNPFNTYLNRTMYTINNPYTSENNSAKTVPLYRNITAVNTIQRTKANSVNDGNTIVDEERIPSLHRRTTSESFTENPETITVPPHLPVFILQPPYVMSTERSLSNTRPKSINDFRHVTDGYQRSISQNQEDGLTNTPVTQPRTYTTSHVMHTQLPDILNDVPHVKNTNVSNLDQRVKPNDGSWAWLDQNIRTIYSTIRINKLNQQIRNTNVNRQQQNKEQYFNNTLMRTITAVPCTNQPATNPQKLLKEPINLPNYVQITNQSENTSKLTLQKEIETNKGNRISILDDNPKSRIQKQIKTKRDVISFLDETKEKIMDESELEQLLLLEDEISIESLKFSKSNKVPETITSSSDVELIVPKFEEGEINIEESTNSFMKKMSNGKTTDKAPLNFTNQISSGVTPDKAQMTNSNKLGQKYTNSCVEVPGESKIRIEDSTSSLMKEIPNVTTDKAVPNLTNHIKQISKCVKDKAQKAVSNLSNITNQISKVQTDKVKLIYKSYIEQKQVDPQVTCVKLTVPGSEGDEVTIKDSKLTNFNNQISKCVKAKAQTTDESNRDETDSHIGQFPTMHGSLKPRLVINDGMNDCKNELTLQHKTPNKLNEILTKKVAVLKPKTPNKLNEILTKKVAVLKPNSLKTEVNKRKQSVKLKCDSNGKMRLVVDDQTINGSDGKTVDSFSDDELKLTEKIRRTNINDQYAKDAKTNTKQEMARYQIASSDDEPILIKKNVPIINVDSSDDEWEEIEARGELDKDYEDVETLDEDFLAEDMSVDDDVIETEDYDAIVVHDNAIGAEDDDVIGEINDEVVDVIADDAIGVIDDDVIEVSDADSDVAVQKSSSLPVKINFFCAGCKIQFCTREIMIQHASSHHKKRFCHCEICQEKPKNLSMYKQEQKKFLKRVQKKPYVPTVSSQSFMTLSQPFTSPLQKPKSYSKGFRPSTIFYCQLCHKIFYDMTSFKAHKTTCLRMPLRKWPPQMKRVRRINMTKKRSIAKDGRTNKWDHNTKDGKANMLPMNQRIARREYAHVYKNCVNTDPITGGKSYVCRFCDRKLCNPSVLMRHEAGYCSSNVDIDDLSLVRCEACCRQFSCTKTLELHTNSFCHKTRESRFICKPCGRKFKTKLDLDFHEHFSSGPKTYTCDYCRRIFGDKDHLRRHVMGHMGMKLYSCPICKRKFARKCNMKEHLESHQQVKKYRCNICDMEFKHRWYMRKHVGRTCSEEGIKKRPFLCDICKKRFTNKKVIELHMIKNHCQSYPCEICNKNFGEESRLSKHLIKHSRRYFCKICKKSYSIKRSLLLHKKTHKKVLCECGQKFNLGLEYYRHRKYWCALTSGKDFEDVVKTDEKLSKAFRKNVAKVEAGKQKSKQVKSKNTAESKSKLEGNKNDGDILETIEHNTTNDEQTNHKDNDDENSINRDEHDANTIKDYVTEQTNDGTNKIEANATEEQITKRPKKLKMEDDMSKILLISKVDLSKDNTLLGREENESFNSKLNDKLSDEKAPQIIEEKKRVSKKKSRETNVANKSKARDKRKTSKLEKRRKITNKSEITQENNKEGKIFNALSNNENETEGFSSDDDVDLRTISLMNIMELS